MEGGKGVSLDSPPPEYFTQGCLSPSGRRWCERVVQVLGEEVVSLRQEEAVPCLDVYQYTVAGWRLDPDRAPRASGPGASLCYIYK